MTQNTDGTFAAKIDTEQLQTVTISAADMIAFIQSKDTGVTTTAPAAPATTAPATTTPAPTP